MQPVRLVLAVQDKGYIEPLLHYIQCSEYAVIVQVTAFTRAEAFLQFMESGSRPDLVVGDTELLKAWLSASESSLPWIALMEGGEEKPEGDGLTVSKYQPLSRLLESWIQYVQERRGGARMDRTEGTRIIGITSALGGCGKTTTAVNMAKQLAVMGSKVFYLNLETVNSSAVFPIGPEIGRRPFSRLLYDLKAVQETGEEADVEPYILRNEALKCDVFAPNGHIGELMEMTFEDAKTLIRSIAGSGRYDFIVLDSDWVTGERFQALVTESHLLWWILLDDLIGMFKSGARLNDLERRDPDLFGNMMAKSRFIVNRYTGSLANSLPRSDMSLDGALPYIPSWKQVRQEEILLCSPIFQREILRLCGDMLGENKIMPSGSTGDAAYA